MRADYTIPTYAKVTDTTVSGKIFRVWSDRTYRSTLAQDMETGKIHIIYGGGYLHKDVTIRKAIAVVFSLPTFRTRVSKTTTKKTKETRNTDLIMD